MGKHLQIDHLVYATPDLPGSVAEIERLVGVAPTPGGAHVGLGTFNALLGLGGRTYLEIVGPDPAQPEPEGPRPFGIDDLTAPALVAWCAAPRRPLAEVVAAAREAGYDPGDAHGMSRRRPDGVLLEWELALSSRAIADGGVLPFFIDWGRTVHPTEQLPIGGSLTALHLVHPQPRSIDIVLSAVSDEGIFGDDEPDITLDYGDVAALCAEIMTANGVVELR